MSPRKPLKQQLSELDARRQALAAKLRKQERTKDTRRKILLGALVLKRSAEENKFAEGLKNWLRKDLPNYLQRESDLALFDDLLKLDAHDVKSSNGN